MGKGLVLELAFAIDDPCGIDAVTLARALIEFGQSVPEGKRLVIASMLDRAAGDLRTKGPKEDCSAGARDALEQQFVADLTELGSIFIKTATILVIRLQTRGIPLDRIKLLGNATIRRVVGELSTIGLKDLGKTGEEIS